jgi:uncharacterized protein (DUF1697 family)
MSARPEPHAILLRGVNVSGANKLPMAEFRDMLAGQGFAAPQTYIQSGNAVIVSADPPATIVRSIRDGIATRFGFSPEVFVRDEPALAAALDHPFGDADPGRVHAFFLAEPDPAADTARLDTLRATTETWTLRPGLFLLHAPEGIGRSKLAEALPRAIRCQMTARNLKTVQALLEMLRSRRREDKAG